MTTVDVLLPLAAVAAAFTATYFFCMRPMRRGHCAMGQAPQQQNQQAQHLEHELCAAREELANLRRQRADSSSTAHSS